MNCPHCGIHIDEHEALPCLDAWLAEDVMDLRRITWIEYQTLMQDMGHGEDNSYAPWWWDGERTSYIVDPDTYPCQECGKPTEHWQPSKFLIQAKIVSDKAGHIVIFSPGASVRDGCYANRKNDWLVEMIPKGGTTEDSVWAYGKTEELARCRAAMKVKGNSK